MFVFNEDVATLTFHQSRLISAKNLALALAEEEEEEERSRVKATETAELPHRAMQHLQTVMEPLRKEMEPTHLQTTKHHLQKPTTKQIFHRLEILSYQQMQMKVRQTLFNIAKLLLWHMEASLQ